MRPRVSILRFHQSLARRRQSGLTMIEMIIVAALLLILATVTLPVARFAIKRQKEAELRQALRQMRNGIDEYKRYSDAGLIPLELGADGYPTELEDLVEPIDLVGQVDKQVRFLRRIPRDPMTGESEWQLMSYQDEPDSSSWGGENVYDVHSMSAGRGLDGELYSEW